MKRAEILSFRFQSELKANLEAASAAWLDGFATASWLARSSARCFASTSWLDVAAAAVAASVATREQSLQKTWLAATAVAARIDYFATASWCSTRCFATASRFNVATAITAIATQFIK